MRVYNPQDSRCIGEYGAHFVITPSDTADIAKPGSHIECASAGSVRLSLLDDDLTVPALSGGIVHELPAGISTFAVKRVWSTGTDANTFIGLY